MMYTFHLMRLPVLGTAPRVLRSLQGLMFWPLNARLGTVLHRCPLAISSFMLWWTMMTWRPELQRCSRLRRLAASPSSPSTGSTRSLCSTPTLGTTPCPSSTKSTAPSSTRRQSHRHALMPHRQPQCQQLPEMTVKLHSWAPYTVGPGSLTAEKDHTSCHALHSRNCSSASAKPSQQACN